MKIALTTLILIFLFGGAVSLGYAQTNSVPHYTGCLEYRLPLVKSLLISDSSEVKAEFAWFDRFLRTKGQSEAEACITRLPIGDTLRLLAKSIYRIVDENPLAYAQWEVGSMVGSGARHAQQHYRSDPAILRPELQNQIGTTYGDSGRAGFLLACDYILHVHVSDTSVRFRKNESLPHCVLVHATVTDVIKGRYLPQCIERAGKESGRASSRYANPANPMAAVPGACLEFEYSPEWQRTLFTDNPTAESLLQDPDGWWIRPGGDYILFLRLAGIGSDSTSYYFSVQPWWGVFGSNGGMYRIQDGIVQDPEDDFALGATGLTVPEWKARLRNRIAAFLRSLE